MKSSIENGFQTLEQNDANENAKLNAKTKSKKQPVAQPEQPKTTNVIDITPIINTLPTDKPITPATLDKLFNLNDGGKTIRRHLRKRYADNHEYKQSWSWAINDPALNDILQYFAQRYAIAK